MTAEEATSYSIITDPRFKGKIGAQDWWGNSLGPLSIMAGYGPTAGRNPYRLNDEEFGKFNEFLKTLRPQFSGFYEIAGIFTALANGTMWIYPGGGDWAVQLLKDQGVPVKSSVPKEGAYLWGEGISLVAGSTKRDAAKKLVDYLMTADGQARVAIKPSYSSIVPNGQAWTVLQKSHPDWAKRLKMESFKDPCAITPWREGRIAVRLLPIDQTVEEWANLWQEFKGS